MHQSQTKSVLYKRDEPARAVKQYTLRADPTVWVDEILVTDSRQGHSGLQTTQYRRKVCCDRTVMPLAHMCAEHYEWSQKRAIINVARNVYHRDCKQISSFGGGNYQKMATLKDYSREMTKMYAPFM